METSQEHRKKKIDLRKQYNLLRDESDLADIFDDNIKSAVKREKSARRREEVVK